MGKTVKLQVVDEESGVTLLEYRGIPSHLVAQLAATIQPHIESLKVVAGAKRSIMGLVDAVSDLVGSKTPARRRR